MKILSISCIHNDIENLMTYADKISLLDFDVIACPGDFSDAPLKGFQSTDIAKIILEELKTFNKPIVAVPGSWDKEVIVYLEDEGVSVHGKGIVINNVGFYGFGGAKTPFNLPFEPSESEITIGLERAFNDVRKCRDCVQVTHSPPARTKIDIIASGAHVGSEAVREFIEKHHPVVAIASHIHESRGIDDLGNTKLVNSGRFPEGYCALVNINNDKVDAKIINLI